MTSCFGGAKRDRTADLYNAIVALSQLSYSPKPVVIADEARILFSPPAAVNRQNAFSTPESLNFFLPVLGFLF